MPRKPSGNAKTSAERQKAYYERQKKSGMVKVSVYVLKDKVEQLQKYAAKLCDD
jgi:hypothetical protein